MFPDVVHVLGTLTPIYAILALGARLRHTGFFPAQLASGLNKLIFNVALPCFIVPAGA